MALIKPPHCIKIDVPEGGSLIEQLVEMCDGSTEERDGAVRKISRAVLRHTIHGYFQQGQRFETFEIDESTGRYALERVELPDEVDGVACGGNSYPRITGTMNLATGEVTVGTQSCLVEECCEC